MLMEVAWWPSVWQSGPFVMLMAYRLDQVSCEECDSHLRNVLRTVQLKYEDPAVSFW